jgi:hypothetical protein
VFAAFLGYNPIQHLVGAATLARLPARQVAALTGRQLFPSLISGPFGKGLHTAFDFAAGCCLVAAGASWLRGGRFVYTETAAPRSTEPGAGLARATG